MTSPNDRTAAAWRFIARAPASAVPPAWIYQRREALSFCARSINAKSDESRLMSLYNGLGCLYGFDRVEAVVSDILGTEAAGRMLHTVRGIQAQSDVTTGVVKVLLTPEELSALSRRFRQLVLQKM